MSVLFKPVATEGSTKKYQIVITVDFPSTNPEEDLKDITKDIVHVLCDADMDGKNKNYYYLLQFLQNMIPDSKTFESMKKQADKVSS